MANLISLNAHDALLEPLPDLKVSAKHTISSALHPVDFTGDMRPWLNFPAEVLNTYNTQTWSQQAIDARFTGLNAASSTTEEHVVVSCETDVQGRFLGRAGQVLGAVFKDQRLDLTFSSFKGARLPHEGYRKLPDFVVMHPSGEAKVVGEAKVPWVPQHSLSDAISLFDSHAEENFRHLLGNPTPHILFLPTNTGLYIGQIATYMLETEIKHGFLTTYDETIFLREVGVNRQWVLEYSPVIFNDNQGSSMGTTGVFLSQCLYHIALVGLGDTKFGVNMGTRNQDWTKVRT
jgi:hypothetical protein